jgi:hypothetical protein
MAGALAEQFITSHNRPPECLILECDATDDPVPGGQEDHFFHGYCDASCFLPLYVFCGDQLLVAYLRPSNIDPARHTRAILKLLVRRLRQAWPEVRVVIHWFDHNGAVYVLGLARNGQLQELAASLMHEAVARWEAARQPVRLFGEFAYAAGRWDRPRRVIVKAKHNAAGDDPRFVVSNLPGTPQALYDAVHRAQGEMENWIKEQQRMLFADRTSCHELFGQPVPPSAQREGRTCWWRRCGGCPRGRDGGKGVVCAEAIKDPAAGRERPASQRPSRPAPPWRLRMKSLG